MGEVGKINIDFYVLKTGNPKILSFFDNSDWVYAEELPSYICITVPGSKKSRDFAFSKNSINTFNSHNLGMSCLKADCTEESYVDLPDGIYTITLKSGYEDIEETKYYLKDDVFNIEYSKVMIKYGIEVEDELFFKQMTKVKGLWEVAKSHTVLGDFVKAQRFFEAAKKELNNTLNNKSCQHCK